MYIHVHVPFSSVVSLSITASGSSFFEAVLRLRRPNKERFPPLTAEDASSFSSSSSIEQYNNLFQLGVRTCCSLYLINLKETIRTSIGNYKRSGNFFISHT